MPLSGRRVLCVVVSDDRLRRQQGDRDRGGGAARGAGADLQLPDRELRRADAARDPRPAAAADGRGAGAGGPLAARSPSSWRAAASTSTSGPEVLVDGTAVAARPSPSWPTSSACGACSRPSHDKARLVQPAQPVPRRAAACACSSARTATSPRSWTSAWSPRPTASATAPLGTLGIFGPSRMEYHADHPAGAYPGRDPEPGARPRASPAEQR